MRALVRPRRWLLAGAALALLVSALAGCGGGGSSSASPGSGSSAKLPPSDGDNDIDSLGQGRYDTDNDANPTYGPAVSAGERPAIVSLIERYYRIAASGNGAEGCSLLYPLVAEATVEEHGHGRGSPALRGGTCAQVLSKIFAQRHRELAEDVTAMHVGWIQRQARQAVALVHFGPNRERVVRVHRALGGWQMYAPIDSGPL